MDFLHSIEKNIETSLNSFSKKKTQDSNKH